MWSHHRLTLPPLVPSVVPSEPAFVALTITKQALIVKVVRIVLLGVLSVPPEASQATSTSSTSTSGEARTYSDAPPPEPEGKGASSVETTTIDPDAALDPTTAVAAWNDDVAGSVDSTRTPEQGEGGETLSLSSPSLKRDDGAEDASAPCSGTEEGASSFSGESSLREGAAQIPLEIRDRDRGGDGGNASPPSPPTAVGPEPRESAKLWACLPKDVRAAVIQAVDVSELQVGILFIALPRERWLS